MTGNLKPQPDLVSRLTAERDALHDALSKLVRYLAKHGGYMSAENQAALRGARRLLEETRADSSSANAAEQGSSK